MMSGRKKSAAFYLEAVLLVLFLLLILVVLVRMFGAARLAGRQAGTLSTAVQLADNAAQTVSASESESALAKLLCTPVQGAYTLHYDASGEPAQTLPQGGYDVRVCVTKTAGPAQIDIAVERGGQIVYSLQTKKYWPAA